MYLRIIPRPPTPSNDEDEINIRREYDNMEWKYLAQDSVYWEQLEKAFVRLWAVLISSYLHSRARTAAPPLSPADVTIVGHWKIEYKIQNASFKKKEGG